MLCNCWFLINTYIVSWITAVNLFQYCCEYQTSSLKKLNVIYPPWLQAGTKQYLPIYTILPTAEVVAPSTFIMGENTSGAMFFSWSFMFHVGLKAHLRLWSSVKRNIALIRIDVFSALDIHSIHDGLLTPYGDIKLGQCSSIISAFETTHQS